MKALLIVLFFLSGGLVSAQQTTWTGIATGTFGTPSNWSNGEPAANIDAIVNQDTVISIAGDTNIAQSLQIDGTSSVSLGFEANSSLTISGNNVSIGDGSSLGISGSGALLVGGTNGIDGGGVLNFASGEILVTGFNLTTGITINLLPDAATLSVINTNGLNATLSGNIAATSSGQFGSGGNGLYKLGSGTLFLSGSSRSFDTFNAGVGTTDQTSGSTSATEFLVGSGSGNTGSFVLDGGSLAINQTVGTSGTTAGSLRVGDFQGSGTFVQNAGYVTVGVQSALNIGNQGGTGVYILNGGTLNLGGGSVNGLARSTGSNPASTGTLDVAGGLLQIQNASSLVVGNIILTDGTAVLNQTSGTISVSGNSGLYVAGWGNGTYNLLGGVLQIGGSSFHAQYNNTASIYAFNFGGGTIQVTGTDLTASLKTSLVAGTSSTIDTNGLNATFSGVITGSNAQLVKTGTGNLEFTSGSNAIDSFFVDGGNFNQNAGETLTSYELGVGSGSGSAASYTMRGGTLTMAAGTPPPLVGGQASSLRVGDFGGSGTFNQDGGLVSVLGALEIGNQGGTGVYLLNGGTLSLDGGANNIIARSTGTNPASTGTLDVAGGLLQLANSTKLIIGNNSVANGTAVLNQTSGTISVTNDSSLYVSSLGGGTYNLLGGVLQIGGSSFQPRYNSSMSLYAFNFGGGTIQVTGTDLTTGVNTTFVGSTTSTINTNGFNATLSGAITGSNAQLVKTGTGNLEFTSGSNAIDSFFVDGGNFNQKTGETLKAYELGVGSGFGSAASYTMSGGTLTMAAGTPPPIVGGQASSFRVGDFGGTGTFNQTGGMVTVNGALNIGNQGGHGTYNLSGGTLNLASGQSDLGRTSGTSASSGGSTGALNVSGTGVLEVSGTAQLVLSNWYPDSGITQGSGTLTQTGGTVEVANTASLALTGVGNGIYDLYGGTLQIGGSSLVGEFGQFGTYSFNLGGGTIQVTGTDLTTSVNMSLVSGASSVINTNGLNATVSGVITGTNSQLAKVGGGSLVLAGAGNEIDSFYIAGGAVSQGAGSSLSSYEVSVGYGITGSTPDVATYTMTSGSLTLLAGTPPPIVGGTTSSLRIGDFGGTGTFNQSGGTVTVNGSLNLGNQGGHGTYDLSGGQLDLISGFSTLGRTSGSNVADGGSTGEIDLSGSAILNIENNASLTLSNWYPATGITQGSGFIDQTGGTLIVANTAELALTFDGTGIYDLFGGTLQIGGASLQPVLFGDSAYSGTYQFNLGGGTILVSGTDLTTSVIPTLIANTVSIINTNGLNATFQDGLGGTGGLDKTGSGSLTLGGTTTLSASSTFQGQFNVGASSGTGSLTVNPGVTVDVVSHSSTGNGSFYVGYGGSGTLGLNGGNITISVLDANGRFEVGATDSTNVPGHGTATMTSGTIAIDESQATGGAYGVMAVGNGIGAAGSFSQSGGTVLTGGAFDIGVNGGSGTYNLSGGTLRQGPVAGSHIFIGDGNTGTGSLNITGSGQFIADSTNFMDVGTEGGNGTITQNGAQSLVTLNGSWAAFGSASGGTPSGTGTYNLESGTFALNSGDLYFGAGTGGTGILNQSGGLLTVSGTGSPAVYFTIGQWGTGVYNLSSGTAAFNANLWIANTGSASGTVNQTGGTLAIGTGAAIVFGPGTGVYNLDGGLLQVGGTDGIQGNGTLNLGGGTIQVTGTDLTSSVAVTLLTATTSTIDTNNLNASLSGVISGTGNLTKAGAGTLILTAGNSYTGNTSIDAGTLQLGNGGASGSIAGNVSDSGVLAFDRSDAPVFGGTISGAGAVKQMGSGTTILTANNTYTGTTTISSGVLQLGNGGTTGSIAGNVSDSATLSFDHSGVSNFSGTISGTGAVQQTGTGTTILTAANTYTGTTTISSGVLQLGNGGTTGSIAGNVSDSATLSFDHSGVSNFSGTISGTGAVQQAGIGTTILTAANTYTGTTTISSGVLQLGNGGTTGSITGNVSDGGMIGFNRSDVSTFNGTISGTGAVQQAGTGTTILTAANTYSGNTVVAAGTLLINNTSGSGAGSGSVDVKAGGVLGGTGSVSGPITVESAGTLAPGSATLAAGGLTLQDDSTIVLRLGTGGDLITDSGAFTLGKNITLSLTELGGFGLGVYQLIDFSGALTDNSDGFNGWTVVGLSGGFSATLSFDNPSAPTALEVTIAAVPEPNATLLILGGTGLLLTRYLLRRSKA